MGAKQLGRRGFLGLTAAAAGGLLMGGRLGRNRESLWEGAGAQDASTSLLQTPAPPGASPASPANFPTATMASIPPPFQKETTLGPNPWVKDLGFGEKDRVLIVHVDDVGMCQANVEAFSDLVDFGLVSSGSVMVPCAWFPLAAHYARTHPQADIGVHLTLTSEWDAIRWRPVSTADRGKGLGDSQGFLHRRAEDAVASANMLAAMDEMDTQIRTAMEAGIDPTHADAHQFVAMMPNFLLGYLRVSTKYKLPPLFQRKDEAGWRAMQGMDPGMIPFAITMTNTLMRLGIPVVDNWFMMPMEQPEHRLEITKQVLDGVPRGISVLIIHATKDSPELHAITPDWRGRVADYATWMSEDLKRHIRDTGIQLLGWRPVRDLWRQKSQ